jgi:hypothetical protein
MQSQRNPDDDEKEIEMSNGFIGRFINSLALKEVKTINTSKECF